MTSKRTESLYSEEISLLAQDEEAFDAYVRLNLRKIKKYRRQFSLPIIGIAGTEGKTITKRMISAILGPEKTILETPPDCSTASGVTSTLLRLTDNHKLAMLELGIVNPKQFEWVVRIAEPTIGVITNIGESHLANLGDKYDIADAKMELVRHLPSNGFAVLNIDDDLVASMAQYAPESRVVKFGLNKNAHFFASNINYHGPDGIDFLVNEYYRFHMPIFSSASIYNALTAISVARLLGIGFEAIQEGLQQRFSLLKRRGNLIKSNDLYLLDYSYDATINSVTKACESLVQFKPFASKLILLIGDLSKPGPNPEQVHLKLGYYLAAKPIDAVITYGRPAGFIARGIRQLNQSRIALHEGQSREEVLKVLKSTVVPGAALMIIGSSELKMHEIVDAVAEL